MHTLVLIRHGESTWNRENRFTGWTDVDLSERGVAEGKEAGRLLREGGYVFDVAYTSVLKRAIKTLGLTLDALDLLWIPVVKDWRLNERHYGALQGLNKAETAAKHGDAQIKIWRRSYDIPPPPQRPQPASPRRRTRKPDPQGRSRSRGADAGTRVGGAAGLRLLGARAEKKAGTHRSAGPTELTIYN